MTVIKKLTARGFKSFAKKTDIVFNRNFNCILGPNGSGKCVKGDSLIYMADGSLIKIKDLIENKFKTNNIIEMDDGFSIRGDNTEVLTLNLQTLKIEKRKVSFFIKRTSPENLLKIRTRSGRIITATEYHPLFIMDKNKIRSIKAEELKEGLRVAVPRQLQIEQKNDFYELIDLIEPKDELYANYDEDFVNILKKYKKNLTWKQLAEKINIPPNTLKGLLDKQSINLAYLFRILLYAGYSKEEIVNKIKYTRAKHIKKLVKIPWKNSPEFSRVLGYLLAEGRLIKGQIWFVNNNEEVIKDYSNLIKSVFEIKPILCEYKANCYDVLAYSAPLVKILKKFGLETGSANKNVTNLYLKNSNNNDIAALLNGLYCGDGYVSDRSIEITTKSEKLATAIEVMLLRLKLNYYSKFEIKTATNSGFTGIYKTIRIYGFQNLNRFLNLIPLVHSKKRKKLVSLPLKKSNPNHDLIEANYLIKQTTKDLDIKIKPLKKDFPKLDAYCYNQCLTSREGINNLVKNLFQPVKNSDGSLSLQALKLVAQSDILWDEIIEIEKIKSDEEWVYDLTIDDHHNFIANGFFVHNSNVCDAITFVLGKTSAKAMRANKSANLIYNGGKKGSPAKEAEVAIHFCNEKGTFPIETKEVVVSRAVKKSGQSIYKINEDKVTRQQVVDLLSSARIDPDGHNVVLQGDIARFMEMKSSERREIVEGIAGISVFEEKKEKAMKDLDKVQERLNEAEIILTERNKTLNDLKKDRDQALKYKELEKNIERNKATRLSLHIKHKNDKLLEIDSHLKNFKNKIDSTQNNINLLKEEIEAKRKTVDEISQKIGEGGDKKQRNLQNDIDVVKTHVTRDATRKEMVEGELRKIKDRKVSLEKNIKENETEIKKLEEQKNSLKSNKFEWAKKEEKLRREISELKKEYGLSDMEEFNKSMADADSEIENKQRAIIEIDEKKNEILRKKDRLDFEINSLNEKLEKVSNLKDEDKKNVEKLKSSKEEIKIILKDLTNALNESPVISAQLADTRAKLIDADNELAKLNARNIGIQEFAAGDMAIQTVLNAGIKGVHGTVSDLGQVSSKYSMALEVAAGGRLRSIVVSTDSVATNCIELLKKNKSGVVTFLPLNKLRERVIDSNAKRLMKEKGVQGLAIDLVQHDKKYSNVFKFVFGSTLIVDDLSTARKLGIGRARMVTLEGDLVEPSGAMIGGHRRKTGMGFKQKEVSSGITRLEKDVETLRKKVDLLESQKTKNSEAIAFLRERKALLEAGIKAAEVKLGDFSDLSSIENSKKDLSSKLKELNNEISLIEKDKSDMVKELLMLKENKTKINSRLKELGSGDVSSKLETLENNLRSIREKIIKTDSEMQSLDNQKKMIVQEIEKTQSILRDSKKEFETFTNEMNELTNRLQENKGKLKDKQKDLRQFFSNYQSMFNQRKKIEDSIQKKELALIQKEERIRSIEHRYNDKKVNRALVAGELEGLNMEFEQYKNVSLRRGIALSDLEAEIKNFENMLKNLGNVNLRALEVYEKVHEEFAELKDKHETLKGEKEDVLGLMYEIEGKKKESFMKTFNLLSKNFSEIFSLISTKGDAMLELENPESPFEEGVDIKMRIMSNRFLDIKSMSGGEKTMAALAFIFAIQEFEPSSFYLLDEVDAALDKNNSELLSKLIAKYAERAQYIVISHNDSIISEADTIYGVSMQDGISKTVSLKI